MTISLFIIDFITNNILFQTTTNRTQYLFLWNKNTIIENYRIDSCAGNDIIDLFDKERKSVFDEQNDFWWTKEIIRIKSKKYGDGLLRIGLEKINLYYIKPEIKKEKEKKPEKNMKNLILMKK